MNTYPEPWHILLILAGVALITTVVVVGLTAFRHSGDLNENSESSGV
ncbi:hypothetical protein [Primorskyibacter sedentarius]